MFGSERKLVAGLAIIVFALFIFSPVNGVATAEAGWVKQRNAAGTVVKKRTIVTKRIVKTVKIGRGERTSFVREVYKLEKTKIKNLLTNKTKIKTSTKLILKKDVKKKRKNSMKIISIKKANCINKTSPVKNKCTWKSV